MKFRLHHSLDLNLAYSASILCLRNRLTDLENELMIISGEGWEGGIVRKFGIGVYTCI